MVGSRVRGEGLYKDIPDRVPLEKAGITIMRTAGCVSDGECGAGGGAGRQCRMRVRTPPRPPPTPARACDPGTVPEGGAAGD